MKFVAVAVTAIFMTSVGLANPNSLVSIEGTLALKKGRPYLINSGEAPLKLEAKNVETSKNLRRLESGDVLSASGRLSGSNLDRFSVEDIAYVGLQRWVGNWKSSIGRFQVANFQILNFSPNSTDGQMFLTSGVYSYSTTFGEQGQWILFLSNSFGTQFATLSFKNASTVILTVNDSFTGEQSLSVELTRESLFSSYGQTQQN